MTEPAKSLLEISRESLIELSSLPHLQTSPKKKSKKEPKKKEGTAGRIGPETIPDKKKPVVGPETKEKIKKFGKDALHSAGRAARDAALERAGTIAKDWVNRISDKISPK